MLNVIAASSESDDTNMQISLGLEYLLYYYGILAVLLDSVCATGFVTSLKFLGVTVRSECKIVTRKAFWLFSPHNLSNCSIYFPLAFQPFPGF